MIKPQDIARVAHAAEQAALLGEHSPRTWDALSEPEQHQRIQEVVLTLAGVRNSASAVVRAVTHELHIIGTRIYEEHVADKIVASRIILDTPPPEEDELTRITRGGI